MLPLTSKLLQIELSPASNVYKQGGNFCLVSGSGDNVNTFRGFEGQLFPFLYNMNCDDEIDYREGKWSTTSLARYYPASPIGVLIFQVSSGEMEYCSRNLITLTDFFIDKDLAYYRFKLEIDDPISKILSRIPVNGICRIAGATLILGEESIRESLLQEYGLENPTKPPYNPTKKPKYLFINIDNGGGITKIDDDQYRITSSVNDQTTNSLDFRGSLSYFIDSYPYVKPTEWTDSNFRRLFNSPPYISLFLPNKEQYNFKIDRVEIDGKVIRYYATLLSSNIGESTVLSFGLGSSQPLKGAMIMIGVESIRNSKGTLSKPTIFSEQVESYN